MRTGVTRRNFTRAAALGMSAAPFLPLAWAQAQQATPAPGRGRSGFAPHPARNMKIGHTGITWPRSEGGPADQAIQDIGSLGYWGFETFGETLDAYEAQGGIAKVLAANNVPLVSGYCSIDFVDPAKRKEGVGKMAAWGRIIRKNGGKVVVLGPNARRPYSNSSGDFPFAEHKKNIVAGLNDAAKALMDVGVVGVLQPHTGMVIEKLDEVFAVLDSMDTKYVKFGPDVGQMVKGGAQPQAVTKLVKDYRDIIQHMHLKDFSGGSYYVGYCPLGFGVVEIPAILDILEGKEMTGMIMVELDSGPRTPMPPLQAAAIAKEYLKNQGIAFRV
jgi:inosose dehydratase